MANGHQRRREAQRAALVLALDERPDAHAEAAPVGVAPPLGDAGRLEAAVHGDRPPLVLAAARLGVVVGAQQVLQRDRAVGSREHAGDEIGGDPEPRRQRLGRAVDEPLHRRLVVVRRSPRAALALVALRRALGSSPARDSARAFSITWSGACTHT